jgi:predicted DCC family thiol-disulfide oxidoreductase YuxK
MQGRVLYDGTCNFCISIAGFIRKRDKRGSFRFIPLQSEEGKALISLTGLPEKDRNTAIYLTGNKTYIRSTAVLRILKDLGGFWKIFFAFIIVPRFIRDFVYKIIARYRSMY